MQLSTLDKVTVTFQPSLPSTLRWWRWHIAADKLIPRDFAKTKATVYTPRVTSPQLDQAWLCLTHNKAVKALVCTFIVCKSSTNCLHFYSKVQFFKSQQTTQRDINTTKHNNLRDKIEGKGEKSQHSKHCRSHQHNLHELEYFSVLT